MRRDLTERMDLLCPVCARTSGEVEPLTLTVEREEDGEILSGHFRCGSCPRRYPVIEGVAVLDPQPLRSAYDRPDFLQAYLWTHYADLAPDALDPESPGRGDYFERLAGQPASGFALDLGCNVGRTTFELARRADFVLGIERSFEAVKRAREIRRTGRVAFHLKDEGDRGRYVNLDAGGLVRDNLEFLCGDAAALPFSEPAADTLLAANLIDRLKDPTLFLHRADRILRPGGLLVLSAPFTWREDATEHARWLGDAARDAAEVLLEWCAENDYAVEETADLGLTIRNHRRFYETLRPFLLRARKPS